MCWGLVNLTPILSADSAPAPLSLGKSPRPHLCEPRESQHCLLGGREQRQKVTPVLTSGPPAGVWGPGKDSGAGEREASGKEAADLDSSTLL